MQFLGAKSGFLGIGSVWVYFGAGIGADPACSEVILQLSALIFDETARGDRFMSRIARLQYASMSAHTLGKF